jgi:hypothetical protein
MMVTACSHSSSFRTASQFFMRTFVTHINCAAVAIHSAFTPRFRSPLPIDPPVSIQPNQSSASAASSSSVCAPDYSSAA